MKTPFQTRFAALLASVLMTFATVQALALHALPQDDGETAGPIVMAAK